MTATSRPALTNRGKVPPPLPPEVQEQLRPAPAIDSRDQRVQAPLRLPAGVGVIALNAARIRRLLNFALESQRGQDYVIGLCDGAGMPDNSRLDFLENGGEWAIIYGPAAPQQAALPDAAPDVPEKSPARGAEN